MRRPYAGSHARIARRLALEWAGKLVSVILAPEPVEGREANPLNISFDATGGRMKGGPMSVDSSI